MNGANLDQYRRAEWGADQGLSSGRIQALAQTRDGYLWIGTAEGLLRFDGIRFVPMFTEDKKPLPQILALTVDNDGVLWVISGDTHLRKVQQDFISSPVAIGDQFLRLVAMAPAHPSGIYATETRKTTLRVTGNQVEQLPIYSHAILISVAEATDHRLWVGTDRGLLSWTGGEPVSISNPAVDQKINCLLPDQGGHMWVGTDDGLAYWDGHRLLARPLSGADMKHLQILTMMQDREANLWIGTSRGLLRAHASGSEWAATDPHTEHIPVTSLLQDREGDIWFGTGTRLERLLTTPIVPVLQSDATSDPLGALYVDWHGRVWFSNGHHGLAWIEHGIKHPVINDGLPKDEVYSIDGFGDTVWVGRRSGGLTRLRLTQGKLESKTWTTRDGLSQNSAYVVRADSSESVWVGTLTAGLNHLANGQFTQFTEENGLPANDISAIEFGGLGQVWIGTSGGVCKIVGKHCTSISSGENLPKSDVLSLLEDPTRGLWIGTSHGLLLADNSGQRLVPLGAGAQPQVLGLGFDQGRRLWIEEERGVMSADPRELLESRNPSIRSYGNEDGLQSSEGVRRSRSVVADSSGQLWFTTAHALARTGSQVSVLPAVIPHVEQVNADGTSLNLNHAKVSPGTKRLSFSFTGLDLRAPSRVRFRYRLDDFEKNWSDVVPQREATYTNLPPGQYTFHLIAANESGSWNSQESFVHVEVVPDLWQRWSVRTALAVVFLLLVVLAYQARTKFLLSQANILADERLRERTRIARDVHDTLLQGFISSSMHLHVAEKQVPGDSPLKQRFTFVLEGMDRVIEDARLAVVGLRTPEIAHGGIESSLRDFFLEIGDIGDAHISLRSMGRPRLLKSEACEQISAIAKESVLNAVRHGRPRNVEVSIDWSWRNFKLEVSDDGCGIDPFTLEHGRAKHWGLVGMRERANQLNGRLMITSDPSEGTKVRLTVPMASAYQKARGPKKPAHRL